MNKLALGLLAACLSLTTAVCGEARASQVRVVDGDTLVIDGARYRLFGIDAPESSQSCPTPDGGSWACGLAAAEKMRQLVQAGGVSCDHRDDDKYGRIVGVCTDGNGTDLNAEMVKAGLAWAFRRYSTAYVGYEEAAHAARIGVWQGDSEAPWDYRAGQAPRFSQTQEAALGNPPPGNCPIKGNISKGGKIYHVPGSKDYDKVRIDTSAGERWFCTEAEAQQAGWRAPRWQN